jgi:hypothetical protein
MEFSKTGNSQSEMQFSTPVATAIDDAKFADDLEILNPGISNEKYRS